MSVREGQLRAQIQLSIRSSRADTMVQDWREIVAKKRAEVAKQLPQEWRLPQTILGKINANADIGVLDIPAKSGVLTSKEVEITEKYDAVELVAKMAAKELSSSEVTLAFCKRAAVAHQVVRVSTAGSSVSLLM